MTARVQQLEQVIGSHTEKSLYAEHFLKIAYKYTDIKELTPKILREFIKRIETHERSICYDKDTTQQIDIYCNSIGMMP